MIRPFLRTLLSHWRRNPVQLFAYLAGLALATALWSGVQAINAEARASYDAAAKTLGEGQYDLLIPRQDDRIPQKDYIRLRRSGWLVSPMIDGRLGDVRLVGIDLVTSATGLGAGNATSAPLIIDAPFTKMGTNYIKGCLDVLLKNTEQLILFSLPDDYKKYEEEVISKIGKKSLIVHSTFTANDCIFLNAFIEGLMLCCRSAVRSANFK